MRHLTLICGSVLFAASHANAELIINGQAVSSSPVTTTQDTTYTPNSIFKAVLQIYVHKL